MQLVNARSGTTGQKLADAMDEAAEPLVEILTQKLEGKTVKLRNPHPKGALARLAWVVGRLGGWDGYIGRGYKPPGPITMTRGLAASTPSEKDGKSAKMCESLRSATASTACHLAQILTTPGAPHIAQGEKLKR